jgi:hypothetical protein
MITDTLLGATIGFALLIVLVCLGQWQRAHFPLLFQLSYCIVGVVSLCYAVKLTWGCACIAADKGLTPCGLRRIAAIYIYLLAGFTGLCLSAHLRNQQTFIGLTSEGGETHHLKTFVDLVYFSTITLFTVGYGDITPKVWWSKLLTSAYVILAFGLQLLVLTFIVQRVPLSKTKKAILGAPKAKV